MSQNSDFTSSLLSAKALSWEWPTGEVLFSQLSFSLNPEKYGLVGPNGVGKSTLARLLARKMVPTGGEILGSAAVCYLPQWEEPTHGKLVSEELMDLWESPRADPALWGPLLEGILLDQPLSSLSGGQWMRVRMARTLAGSYDLLILDEPTNNLDLEARTTIENFVQDYRGGLLLISHDRELLNHVDKILEISSQGLSVYGGNYIFYREQREGERARQQTKLERARRDKKKTEKELHEKLMRQDKRIREGKRIGESGSLPRIVAGGLKRQAQVTRGKIASREEKRVEKSDQGFQQIWQQTKQESLLGLVLPDTAVPEGKLVFELEEAQVRYPGREHPVWREPLSFSMRGPRRYALAGNNGSGKTTFIRALLGLNPEMVIAGKVHKGQVVTAVLDQDYSCLDFSRNVLENLMESSGLDLVEARNSLARFQFTGDKVLQPVRDLSGGEKLKAALAKTLLASPAPQFLILDEPTNNLDLVSLEILEAALRDFRGALLVISHDEEFLKNIAVERVYVLQS